MDRHLNEVRRAEDGGIDVQIRKTRPHRIQRVVDSLGDLQGVGPREFLDDEQQTRTAVDDGVADERLMTFDTCATSFGAGAASARRS